MKPAQPYVGAPIAPADYDLLLRSWITPELADQALLRRVTSAEGAQVIGRKDNGSYAGIIFPYVWPGENHCREYRLRRDHPEVQYDAHGVPKEKNKYLGPPRSRNLLYLVPGTDPSLLQDPAVPVAITEGAKKTIALHRLSWHEISDAAPPRFLPVGLAGVWSFKGKIGTSPRPDGVLRSETGVIPDIERILWESRKVFVVYDTNVLTNPSVAAARRPAHWPFRTLSVCSKPKLHTRAPRFLYTSVSRGMTRSSTSTLR